jgi:hypothetical protein
MSPVEIRDHLRRTPFQPIRICMSDGSTYDVPHREGAFVTRTTIAIAMQLGADGLADRMVYYDPLHVTRILPLDPTPANGDRSPDNGRS